MLGFAGLEDFVQVPDKAERLLGSGGCSTVVEMCFRKSTGYAYALKKFSGIHMTGFSNEARALRLVTRAWVPRTIQLIRVCEEADKGWIVTSLVDGWELDKWRTEVAPPLNMAASEVRFKKIAVQLLQTINFMHTLSKGLAHLDITNHNIMIRKSHSDPWDQIRLVDYGLASVCTGVLQSSGFRKYVQDTDPRGCSMHFAPSEQLRSYQLYMQGYEDHPEMKIDGPAADQWASGAVMFQLLTGDLPFIPGRTKPLPLAPERLMGDDDKREWQLYEDMRYLHRQWDAAVQNYRKTGVYQHPMFDKIRQHSDSPDLACEFFMQVLSLDPYSRHARDFNQMPYLKPVADEMNEAIRICGEQMKEEEDFGFGEDYEYVEDFGDISDEEGEAREEEEAPEDKESHEDDAGQPIQSALQQDSPASISQPHDSSTNIESVASSSITSSSSSGSSSSSDFQTARSSSSSPTSGSNAEDQVAAAASDIPAQPVQPTMSSAADVDTNNSDMQSDVQPGLPVCAETPSALQPHASPAREAHAAPVLYPDDPACDPKHMHYTPSPHLDAEAAAADVRVQASSKPNRVCWGAYYVAGAAWGTCLGLARGCGWC